jgi:hypothetical protein
MVKATASVRAFPSKSDLFTQLPLKSVVGVLEFLGSQEIAIKMMLSGKISKYFRRFMDAVLAKN